MLFYINEALGKVTTYARKLQNNLDELALVQWVKNDAKSFVLAAYKKTKKWVKGGWREGLSIGVDFIPVVGNLKAGIEAVIGGPLVKGAKHVGKGAMKIIPNSNKLVNSLSKPLAKLKEGGQKVAEKAMTKATELKAQANAMMAQVKQGMRESMDNVGRALRGNEPQLAMVGAKAGAVKNSDSVVWMSKGEGNVKHLDDVPRIKEIEVNFKRNVKHDSEEFARQLKDQEKGMNELTVDEYLKNRDRYIAEGRAVEGNVAQQTAREEAFSDKVAELMSNGKSFDEAEKEVKEWLNTQAALHNPDQIAGMGHKGINSSIGSQWRYRIDVVDEQIREMAKNMTPEQLKSIYLNVKLTH
ncbi:polymorphic toxin type 15 domain-containing protein [Metasolibacillus sp. FSL K6-0083]|uniref:polymorphic toxin type 15 domain-containing protein n=1 Tax=Metasolibacillus sp. FSL K6-0083 TaxID=2921416 RepID=UPI00315A9479